MEQSLEQWLPVVGYENRYFVSNLGQVRGPRGRALRPSPSGQSKLYDRVMLYPDRSRHLVHVLVLTAFVGPRPLGQVARHLDGNPRNNRLDNLAWGTCWQNQMDRILHGTDSHGDRHPLSRLTKDQVAEIRARYCRTSYHASNREELAAEFGIHPLHLLKIVRGVSWDPRFCGPPDRR